jgi:LPXTG-site transpeptidase (sortase) family protein
MFTPPRNARQYRSSAFYWMAGLLLVIGLGISSFVLVMLFNDTPPPAESSVAQVSASSTPTAEPTKRVLPESRGEEEPTASIPTRTPESTPSSTAESTPLTDNTPVPETDNATSEEAPDTVATVTSEPEPSSDIAVSSPSSIADSSPGNTDNTSSSDAVQDVTEPAPPDPNSAPVSNAPLTQLEIPAIGVVAPVEVKSIDANGVMENPSSPHAVAWYDFTSRPEGNGNSVFAGHLDYAGVGPAVFWNLGSLKPGDEVTVRLGNGHVVGYRITGVRSVHADADASDIVASGDIAKITIITCAGSFDPSSQEYDQRIVVTGERVG